jgi:hypothetical protein
MNTKPIIHVGIALVLLGLSTLTYQGFTYTSREKVVDVDRLQAGAGTTKTIPLSPLVGGLLLGGGIVLVAVGIKKWSWRH